jgi:hypothetical protein
MEIMGEDRFELLHEGESTIVKTASQGDQPFIQRIQKNMIYPARFPVLLQGRVALPEIALIPEQLLQVIAIVLPDTAIHELPPQFAAAQDDLVIIRGDHHGIEAADVIAQPGYRGIIEFDQLLFTLPASYHYTLLVPAAFYSGLNPEKVAAFPVNELVGGCKIAFRETRIVQSIQKIGLSRPVVARDTIQPGMEFNLSRGITFEIGKL